MNDSLMTIRQMCDAFNVTPRSLRYYETRNLISPQRSGHHRLYDKSSRGRLKLILQGKRFGLSLEEIRNLLELYNPHENNITQLTAALGFARIRLAEMIQQHEELGQAIIELTEQSAEIERLLAARKTD